MNEFPSEECRECARRKAVMANLLSAAKKVLTGGSAAKWEENRKNLRDAIVKAEQDIVDSPIHPFMDEVSDAG